MFQEIDHVADVERTLDATFADSINPGASFNKYDSGAIGVLPATGALLSVGGTIGDSGHRCVNIYQAVDFARLVESKPTHAGLQSYDPSLADTGPDRTLKYAKFPNPGNTPPLGVNRQVKDELRITFVPVCVCGKYLATQSKIEPHRMNYHPPLMIGSPTWVNFLPACSGTTATTRAKGLSAAWCLNNVNRIGTGVLSP